jgi:hypothetical protein
MEPEIRTFKLDECRVVRDDGKAPVVRLSLRFNALSHPLGMFMPFREKIAPTAFDSALNDESREVMAYWNHDTSKPLARRSRGTLRLSKTETLFKAEFDPGETSWSRDAVSAIERGDVEGMSFRFRVPPEGDRWEEDKDRNLIRTLVNVEIEEVSPTPEPAYPKSTASVRSVFEAHQQDTAAASVREANQIAERRRRDVAMRDGIRRTTPASAG